ncbi:MAG: hypothetical protein R6U89_10705 [Dehalococcoidia bacterium]
MNDAIHQELSTLIREGKVDMLDRFSVVDECLNRGFTEAADWVIRNPHRYALFIVELLSTGMLSLSLFETSAVNSN